MPPTCNWDILRLLGFKKANFGPQRPKNRVFGPNNTKYWTLQDPPCHILLMTNLSVIVPLLPPLSSPLPMAWMFLCSSQISLGPCFSWTSASERMRWCPVTATVTYKSNISEGDDISVFTSACGSAGLLRRTLSTLEMRIISANSIHRPLQDWHTGNAGSLLWTAPINLVAVEMVLRNAHKCTPSLCKHRHYGNTIVNAIDSYN